MARRAIEVGPAGRDVAANLATIRKARGLTTRELTRLTAAAGRAIPPSGITRIEAGERRVDIDDLVILAKVLGVRVEQLLANPQRVRVTIRIAEPSEED